MTKIANICQVWIISPPGREEEQKLTKNVKLNTLSPYLCAERTRERHGVPVTRGDGVHVQGVGHVSEGVQPDHLVLGEGQLLDQAEQDQGGDHGGITVTCQHFSSGHKLGQLMSPRAMYYVSRCHI